MLALAFVTDVLGQDGNGAARFTIDVPQRVLDDLRERLERTRWPDQLPGTGWDYGADTAYLRELVEYWRDDFDWRAQESKLNRFAHFRASVDGERLHFIHERSADPNAIPLLLLHGWPSSFVQMLDIIPLLTDPAAHGLPGAPSFHVVAASLPGFGFSDPPQRTRVGFATSAAVLAQAHDRGARLRPIRRPRERPRRRDRPANRAESSGASHRRASHGHHRRRGGQPPFTPAEQAEFVDATRAVEPELAYARLQMSKPQTLAHALTDSPVGLAAWIVEKFRAWGDTNGDVESRFDKDDLLTNLTIYWATGTAASSVRIYYEFVREPLKTGRVETPVGMLMSHKDLFPAGPP